MTLVFDTRHNGIVVFRSVGSVNHAFFVIRDPFRRGQTNCIHVFRKFNGFFQLEKGNFRMGNKQRFGNSDDLFVTS